MEGCQVLREEVELQILEVAEEEGEVELLQEGLEGPA
jgi:hypothetical protein